MQATSGASNANLTASFWLAFNVGSKNVRSATLALAEGCDIPSRTCINLVNSWDGLSFDWIKIMLGLIGEKRQGTYRWNNRLFQLVKRFIHSVVGFSIFWYIVKSRETTCHMSHCLQVSTLGSDPADQCLLRRDPLQWQYACLTPSCCQLRDVGASEKPNHFVYYALSRFRFGDCAFYFLALGSLFGRPRRRYIFFYTSKISWPVICMSQNFYKTAAQLP